MTRRRYKTKHLCKFIAFFFFFKCFHPGQSSIVIKTGVTQSVPVQFWNVLCMWLVIICLSSAYRVTPNSEQEKRLDDLKSTSVAEAFKAGADYSLPCFIVEWCFLLESLIFLICFPKRLTRKETDDLKITPRVGDVLFREVILQYVDLFAKCYFLQEPVPFLIYQNR